MNAATTARETVVAAKVGVNCRLKRGGLQGGRYLPAPVTSTQLSTSMLPAPASGLSAAVWNSVSVHSHSA